MERKYKYAPINWRAVFAESGFIGASIIIAFWLQNWGSENDIEERTMIALCNVKSELVFNRILLKSDYIPRQRGMSSLSSATIVELQTHLETKTKLKKFQQMLMGEPLRYSAWALAGESGYLVHADFELATEIGALIHYQEERYKAVIEHVNNELFALKISANKESIENFVVLSDMINELIIQTEYLEKRYETLFQKENFINLECG